MQTLSRILLVASAITLMAAALSGPALTPTVWLLLAAVVLFLAALLASSLDWMRREPDGFARDPKALMPRLFTPIWIDSAGAVQRERDARARRADRRVTAVLVIALIPIAYFAITVLRS